MKKTDVEQLLRRYFSIRHWFFQSVCFLPAAYLRNVPVTPYFYPRVLRRANRTYQVDGYLGVIDQNFENDWIKNHSLIGPRKYKNNYCFIRNLANFSILMSKSYIRLDSCERDVESFCNVVSDLLEGMPHDERHLRIAFENNVLCGTRADSFANGAAGDKYLEFKRYVLTKHVAISN